MPRYFFHFSDGKRMFSDDIGQELHGLAAARRYAVEQVRELKGAMCDPHIQDLSGWTMTVADRSRPQRVRNRLRSETAGKAVARRPPPRAGRRIALN